jgi:hypothetical protein
MLMVSVRGSVSGVRQERSSAPRGRDAPGAGSGASRPSRPPSHQAQATARRSAAPLDRVAQGCRGDRRQRKHPSQGDQDEWNRSPYLPLPWHRSLLAGTSAGGTRVCSMRYNPDGWVRSLSAWTGALALLGVGTFRFDRRAAKCERAAIRATGRQQRRGVSRRREEGFRVQTRNRHRGARRRHLRPRRPR